MIDFPVYYNVPGFQEEFHVFIAKDYSVNVRCDGSRDDSAGVGKNMVEARYLAETYIINYLEKLGPQQGEFGRTHGWLENYLSTEDYD